MFHAFLAYHLAVQLDLKMLGVALATSIHFFTRFLI